MVLFLIPFPACSQDPGTGPSIKSGAEQTELYLPLLSGKKVGVLANQTSILGNRNLVDTLISMGVDVKKIFSPEHGFRGREADGTLINDETDLSTGLPVISLYGKNRKPLPDQISDLDIIIIDIQDVGVRFYTFISTMHYLMEACAENGVEFLVLDRPNPNGDYIDGPVLEKGFESFIGMHPVPVVHGMTIGEFAKMINGEGWLKDSITCHLTCIPCKNYSHEEEYMPPLPPSPNLPNFQSIRLYPSLGLFEGTIVSEGRGTEFPFQVFGFPGFSDGTFEFTPVRIPGVSEHPKFENQVCSGIDLRNYAPEKNDWQGLHLEWLVDAYNSCDKKENFFIPYFDKLAGTDKLRIDIRNNVPIDEIRKSWEPSLLKYKSIRQKYLLYK